ncbi:unnamed protein product, partial [Symbiodinium sp. CCMP2592]
MIAAELSGAKHQVINGPLNMMHRRYVVPTRVVWALAVAAVMVFRPVTRRFCLVGIGTSCSPDNRFQHLQPKVGMRVSSPESLQLPRHPENDKANKVLAKAERLANEILSSPPSLQKSRDRDVAGRVDAQDRVYANTFVDLGSAKVIGFDYDYTLVSYKPAVLHLIYRLATEQLVSRLGYPRDMLNDLPGYDAKFAIRGLAVDLKTAWICMLTLRYRVSIAFFGREQVDPSTVRRTYRSETGSGILPPEERKKRFKPLNDMFSTAEACLLADVVQWFRRRKIPFDPRSVVTDVLNAVARAHISEEVHRSICDDLEKFVEPDGKQHLRQLLDRLHSSGKKLMLVSNSPFWFVNTGMVYVCGEDWRKLFDVVVVSAGKPAFYTQNRPFREVSTNTGRIKFKPIESLSAAEVYCQGSIGELVRLMGWDHSDSAASESEVDGSSIIYMGDSLFADLVDARRLYGWTTGAIIREVGNETQIQSSADWQQAWRVLQVLTLCTRQCQDSYIGWNDACAAYSEDDRRVLDELEALSADFRGRLDMLMNPNFGSIFRTSRDNGQTAQPSLFARCLQRHVDFYTSKVENLRFYSTDHRFYPADYSIGVLHEVLHLTDPISDALQSVHLWGLSPSATFQFGHVLTMAIDIMAEVPSISGAPSALQPGKVDDAAILRCIDKLQTWDASRFEVLATLQSCPRNAGQVRLVQDRSTGRRLAVKRMPLSWTCEDAESFSTTHPTETEVPWMDMAATRWLNVVGFQHCVEYWGVFLDDDYVAFVMGLAEGGDLFTFVDAMGLPEPGPILEEALRPLA